MFRGAICQSFVDCKGFFVRDFSLQVSVKPTASMVVELLPVTRLPRDTDTVVDDVVEPVAGDNLRHVFCSCE